MISDRAIPFLVFKEITGKKIPVCDDVVIYGSTMKTVVDKLSNIGVLPQPYCLIYDIENARLKNINFQKPLTSEKVVAFCHEIVQAFSILGIPYDVDHPIFC